MLKSIRNSLILSSVLYVILGIVLLAVPELSLNLACLLAGGAVTVYGVVRLAAYLRGGEQADRLDLVLGVLLILLGLCLLIWIRVLLFLVPLVLGVYLVRMLRCFPDTPPMEYQSQSILGWLLARAGLLT